MATDIQLPMKFLGKSGLKVSNVCLGTLTFGQMVKGLLPTASCPTQCDEKTSHTIMDKYLELGGNFLDTANVYGMGRSEEIIGTWLKKQQRERIILATKVRCSMDPTNPNKVGLSRRHLVESCNESLERLQTDYIDLFQTHIWDAGTPIEETLRTLDDLVRAGKIRYFGFSNVCGWQLQKLVDTTKMLGLNHIISLQQQYNLLCRQSELDEFVVCQNEGVGVMAWSPLKGAVKVWKPRVFLSGMTNSGMTFKLLGMLAGKFKRGEKLSNNDSRIGFVAKDEAKANPHIAPAWSQYTDNEQYWKLIGLMHKLAQKYDKSIAAIALKWVLQQDVVSSVVIGVTSIKQLEDNMSAGSGWQLTDEEMKQLSEASPRVVYYPFDVILSPDLDGTDRYNPYNH